MIRDRHIVFEAAAAALLFCGCADTGLMPTAQDPARLSRQAEIIEEIKSIKQELRSLRASQEGYDHRFSDETFSRPIQESLSRTAARLNEIEKRLDSLEQSVAADRKETGAKMQAVIEAVKGENAQLRQAIMKMQASDASKGWEHTVGPGDTLAGVAKKYGARVKDIIEANELKDPDTIRSGQKLFIPRPAR